MISFIWAMDENRVIGNNNKLPWHLPADLKFFKEMTMGHPIAMGRKTRDSIGRNLPGRENIVITRNKEYTCEGCTVFSSLESFVEYSAKTEEEIFVIGGAEVFRELFAYADKLYLTKIHDNFPGDTFFPNYDEDEWVLVSAEKGIKDENNPYEYEFLIYERKSIQQIMD